MATTLKLRANPRFLSSIYDGTGTAVRKDGLATYIDWDPSQFAPLGSYDPAEQQVAVQSSSDDSFGLVTLSQIIADARGDRVSVLDFIPSAAHADIRAGTSVIDLSSYLSDAQAYVAALDKPSVLFFPSGQYTYSVSPNWALDNFQLLTEGDVYLNYTGTGNCFIVDGGASPASGVVNMNIGRFRIIGTSSAAHGAYFRAIHHSTIEGPTVHGCGTTSDGIRTEFCVLSQWNRPTVSNNEGSFGSAAPAVGMRLAQRSANGQTAYCTVVNPIMEGLAVGMWLDDSIGNNIIGGALEGCSAQGLLTSTTAVYNKVYGTDLESNTQDIYCAGDFNSFVDCDTQTSIILDASTNGNIIKGGVHKAITIQASATNNCVEFVRYNFDNSGATIADSGTNTRLFSNLNIGSSTWSSGSISFSGLLTASGGIVVTGGVQIDNSNTLSWANGSYLYGAATTGSNLSTFRLVGAGATTALNFGGDTASFPSLIRSGTTLKARLANDSGDAPFTAATISTSGQYQINGVQIAASDLSNGTLGSGKIVLANTVAMMSVTITGVNFNSANTDNAITIVLPAGYTRYMMNSVRISGASASLTTATAGVFTSTGGGGVAIATTAALTISTASDNTNNNAASIVLNNINTESYNSGTVYFRITTPQGSAATANVTICYFPLP